MKKTKYLNKEFGNWLCTYVGIARVQPKFYIGTKNVSKRPSHQTYYYIFERITSDKKAAKLVRLNASEAAKVYRGVMTVEDFVSQREQRKENKFTQKISYHFLGIN